MLQQSKRARLNRPSSTLLDARLKSIGFYNQGQAQAQCFKWIKTPPYPNTQAHTKQRPSISAQPAAGNAGLWCEQGRECYRSCREQWCMSDPPLARSEEVPQTCLPQPFQVGQKICTHAGIPRFPVKAYYPNVDKLWAKKETSFIQIMWKIITKTLQTKMSLHLACNLVWLQPCSAMLTFRQQRSLQAKLRVMNPFSKHQGRVVQYFTKLHLPSTSPYPTGATRNEVLDIQHERGDTEWVELQEETWKFPLQVSALRQAGCGYCNWNKH